MGSEGKEGERERKRVMGSVREGKRKEGRGEGRYVCVTGNVE